MEKFKVGDLVDTSHGIGKIVEYDKFCDNYLVYHYNWDGGHNGNSKEKGHYEGNHYFWYPEDSLEPVETISNFGINIDGTENLVCRGNKVVGGINLGYKYKLIPNKISIMPDRYVINKGATVLFWGDGTKTIVKRSENDAYDKRLGFLTAYFQKTSGMSKTKANKYLDSLVEQEVKDKKNKWGGEATIKVSEDAIDSLRYALQEISKPKSSTYKVGDKVKVIDTGKLYTTYPHWFKGNNCEELQKHYCQQISWNFDNYDDYIDLSKTYKIVAIGKHLKNNEIIILAIRPLYSKKIYLIGEKGVEKV